ncbi:sensor histidine kinase [Crossiella cryophila]|uniref:histidine kinase n=1 Tax=Crossiella cryophila TaxID=43355 RepID=A0A7W7FV18_9PSEU|nr:HAMP domain-containing sensor histidine kinase [Crossiella cryophila]MBB4678590.1 two-component system sensor histidine kinase BaeS [Crossiella cryophila]
MARRNSLLIRFFAVCLLIAAVSIVAATLLTTLTSTPEQHSRTVEDDHKLYERLLEHAVTHQDWSRVQPVLDSLREQTGREIVLRGKDGRFIADNVPADSTAALSLSPPSAMIDPLHVDLALKPGPAIDPRALGPYALSTPDGERLWRIAGDAVRCDTRQRMEIDPAGRPHLVLPDGGLLTWTTPGTPCLPDPKQLTRSTPGELAANTALLDKLTDCLRHNGPKSSTVDTAWADPENSRWFLTPPPPGTPARVADCLTAARRDQLAATVAPPALLYASAPALPAPALLGFDQLPRILLIMTVILVLAGAAAWVLTSQLVRPIRELTEAARRLGTGDRAARVCTTARGELGELARAFNLMSIRVTLTEAQRQALISDVAHELRTPVANITGWLEAVQDGLAAPDPQLTAMLLEESLFLERLVDDLQDLAQADAGTLRLHPEPINTADVIEHVVSAHRVLAEGNEVALRMVVDGPLHLTADPVRLRQALGNLVSNALRYTQPGGAVVVTGRVDEHEAVLEVTDTGIGIAAEDLPHVFDRFWRADKSRSRRTGGSGLGLTITRYLVEAHGGTIRVTSEVGRGSTFRVVLPVQH